MTNKEAIVRINNMIKLIKSPRAIVPYCPEEMEALDLAIKALEKRPQGEWINQFIGGNECVMCSECKLHFDIGTN